MSFSSTSKVLQSRSGSKPPSLSLAEGLAEAEPEPEADGDEPPVGELDALELCEPDADGDEVCDSEADPDGLDSLEPDGEEEVLSEAEEPADGEPLSSAKAVDADSRASGTMAAVAAMVTSVRRSFMEKDLVNRGGEAFRMGVWEWALVRWV
ncbi:hypothetical protein ACWC9X_27225 [Streptomyces asoensis]|uniref:hypothetical protein n=1 Tax=Streptomyces asoensis TaxID=249586 RepID=UPI003716D73F